MGYSKITKAQLDDMQFNAGVLVSEFNINSPSIETSNIVCATTGGFMIDVVPSIIDLSEDVYMMEPNTLEMMHVTGWSVDAEFTCICFGSEQIQMALGAAKKSDNSIIPQLELEDADFTDLYWIGDRVDGGLVCIKLINALSNDGISITTTPRGRGEIAIHLTAHASLEGDFDSIPVEIYSIEAKLRFDVALNQFLYVYNPPFEDTFRIDEETGELWVRETGSYIYTVNVETGQMEVSENG